MPKAVLAEAVVVELSGGRGGVGIRVDPAGGRMLLHPLAEFAIAGKRLLKRLA